MTHFSYCKKLPHSKYEGNPPFGKVFSPHCLRLKLNMDQTLNFEAEIVPFKNELYSPATVAFHYGQTIFEGMKAFSQNDGSVGIFRPDLHSKRFILSADRLNMAKLPEEVFTECLKEYVAFEKDSVPTQKDHALYLRPFMIATDKMIKLGVSKTYDFYIISCTVGNYFKDGLKPARVLVNPQFVRAFPGGLGEAKTGANYAASLGPQSVAEAHECAQVLYLDAVHHDYVDELGGMNFFIVKNGQLITPELNGAILNGVTRRSILELAFIHNLEAREEKISFNQLVRDIQSGLVTEAFACGTAAVIQPLGEFVYQNPETQETTNIPLPNKYPVAAALRETLTAIQRGEKSAPGSWILKAEPKASYIPTHESTL